MVNRKPLSSDIIHTYVYGMPRGAERGGGCNCCAFQQPLAAHAILIMRNSQPCTRNDGAWPLNGRRKEWKGVCSHLNYASRCYCIQCDHRQPTETPAATIQHCQWFEISTIL